MWPARPLFLSLIADEGEGAIILEARLTNADRRFASFLCFSARGRVITTA